MEPYKVWIMPPALGLPNASPFVLKLLTWFRFCGVPHEAGVLQRPPRSSTGKVPYIEEEDGSLLSDSSKIISVLTARHELTLDDHLSAAQRAHSLALQRMMEEHLYWASLASRWVPDDAWRVTRDAYFAAIPMPIRLLVTPFIRRKVIRDFWGHGLGRMPIEEVWERAALDVDALATTLGDEPYLLGELSSVDATLFAWMANIVIPPGENPLKLAVQRHQNLVRYVERVKGEYWPDWDEACRLR